MKTLTPAERSALRARAHALRPVVMIGNAGLTPVVIKEIDINLKSHELIKIRVLGDNRRQRRNLIDEICRELDASPVQLIGKILVIFRLKTEPDEKKSATAPRRRKTGKAPRRTKRSYQMQ